MTGKDVVDFLKGKNSLLDSILTSICIESVDGGVVLTLCFRARSGAEYKIAQLKFRGIIQFGFYYSSEFSFYNVEAIKFFVTEGGGAYLALDPDQRRDGDSEDDQDFVRAKFVEALIG